MRVNQSYHTIVTAGASPTNVTVNQSYVTFVYEDRCMANTTGTLDIWNNALTRLGRASILSVDSTDQDAIAIKAIWDQVRRAFISDYPWNGAKKTRRLMKLADAPIDRWDSAFALPSDYLNALYLNGLQLRDGGDDWEIEIQSSRRVLKTDQVEACLEYVADVDPCLLSAQAQIALSYALAGALANRLNKSEVDSARIRQGAELELLKAKSTDGQEGKARYKTSAPRNRRKGWDNY